MGGIDRIGAVNTSRRDYPYGGLALFHSSYLNGGGLCSEQDVLVYIECVLRISCGVVLGHIQRLEAVIVAFYLRALNYIEAHAEEHLLHLCQNGIQRVRPAHLGSLSGKRYIEPFSRQPFLCQRRLDLGLLP